MDYAKIGKNLVDMKFKFVCYSRHQNRRKRPHIESYSKHGHPTKLPCFGHHKVPELATAQLSLEGIVKPTHCTFQAA